MTTRLPELLLSKMYSYADADRLAGLSQGTARRWLGGYSYTSSAGQRRRRPPVIQREPEVSGVSFAELIELVAVREFRDLGFSLPALRRLIDTCREVFMEPYPLSALSFKTGGRDIFVDKHGVLHDVLRQRGQLAWKEVLDPFLARLDYRDGYACRWWPLGRSRPIVVDPEYGYGLPVIQDSGVRTELVRERMEAGDSIQQIADDFNEDPARIEAAIQFELQRAA